MSREESETSNVVIYDQSHSINETDSLVSASQPNMRPLHGSYIELGSSQLLPRQPEMQTPLWMHVAPVIATMFFIATLDFKNKMPSVPLTLAMGTATGLPLLTATRCGDDLPRKTHLAADTIASGAMSVAVGLMSMGMVQNFGKMPLLNAWTGSVAMLFFAAFALTTTAHNVMQLCGSSKSARLAFFAPAAGLIGSMFFAATQGLNGWDAYQAKNRTMGIDAGFLFIASLCFIATMANGTRLAAKGLFSHPTSTRDHDDAGYGALAIS